MNHERPFIAQFVKKVFQEESLWKDISRVFMKEVKIFSVRYAKNLLQEKIICLIIKEEFTEKKNDCESVIC